MSFATKTVRFYAYFDFDPPIGREAKAALRGRFKVFVTRRPHGRAAREIRDVDHRSFRLSAGALIFLS